VESSDHAAGEFPLTRSIDSTILSFTVLATDVGGGDPTLHQSLGEAEHDVHVLDGDAGGTL